MTTIAMSVEQQIADDILSGRLAPGAKLDEQTLAARFEVSRTPVRAALRQLLGTGLVEPRDLEDLRPRASPSPQARAARGNTERVGERPAGGIVRAPSLGGCRHPDHDPTLVHLDGGAARPRNHADRDQTHRPAPCV